MLSMLPARRADEGNFFPAGRIDMTHQTAVLLRIKIPEYVAAAEPKIPNFFSELHCSAIVIDQQDFPRAEHRATVLRRAIEEHRTVPRLPVQLFVLAVAISNARMPHFIATPTANEFTGGMVLVKLRNGQFARDWSARSLSEISSAAHQFNQDQSAPDRGFLSR
jgi:hypothetical protein